MAKIWPDAATPQTGMEHVYLSAVQRNERFGREPLATYIRRVALRAAARDGKG